MADEIQHAFLRAQKESIRQVQRLNHIAAARALTEDAKAEPRKKDDGRHRAEIPSFKELFGASFHGVIKCRLTNSLRPKCERVRALTFVACTLLFGRIPTTSQRLYKTQIRFT
jgi:hypothetical protein